MLLVLTGIILAGCGKPSNEQSSFKPADAEAPGRTALEAVPEPVQSVEQADVVQTVSISGRVIYTDGEAVTGMPVWIERLETPIPVPEQCYFKTPILMVTGTVTSTDLAGTFRIEEVPGDIRYIVKCAPREYPAGYSGPYGPERAAGGIVTIKISRQGGRITGVCLDEEGHPLANGIQRLRAAIKSGNESWVEREYTLAADNGTDGTFITERLQPGRYQVTFLQPGYREESREIIIRDKAIEMALLRFKSAAVVTGMVINAATGNPLAGVGITSTDERTQYGIESTPFTDEQGQFIVRASQYCMLKFRRKGYAPATWFYSPNAGEEGNGGEPVVEMSPPATIRLTLKKQAGTEQYPLRLDAHDVRKGEYGETRQTAGGSVVLSNIPSHVRAVNILAGYKSTQLAESGPIEVYAGLETNIEITLPETGYFTIAGRGIENKNQYLNINGNNQYISRESFIKTANGYICPFVEPGVYNIVVNGRNGEQWTTNAVMAARQTAALTIPEIESGTGTLNIGLRMQSGMPVQGYAQVNEGNMSRGYHTDMSGNFSIDNCKTDREYTVAIRIENYTNLTINGIVADSMATNIIIPDGQMLSAYVTDALGTALRVRAGVGVGNSYNMYEGEIQIFPVYPGERTLCIDAEGYAPVYRDVQVADSDLDAGTIILTEQGYSLKGRVLRKDGNPASGANISISGRRGNTYLYSSGCSADKNGRFKLEPLSSALKYYLYVWDSSDGARGQVQLNSIPVGEEGEEIDLGDIYVKQQVPVVRGR